MLSQKVVFEQWRFGVLGPRLESEQALTTSSPCVLHVSLARVPAEAAVQVRGWGFADVLCWPGLGGVLHSPCPLAQQDLVGTLESLGWCVHTRESGLFAE